VYVRVYVCITGSKKTIFRHDDVVRNLWINELLMTTKHISHFQFVSTIIVLLILIYPYLYVMLKKQSDFSVCLFVLPKCYRVSLDLYLIGAQSMLIRVRTAHVYASNNSIGSLILIYIGRDGIYKSTRHKVIQLTTQ
jgi:hypothetical protein